MWREGIGGSVALCFGLWGVGGGEKRGFWAAKTKIGEEADCGGRIPVQTKRKGKKKWSFDEDVEEKKTD